MTEKDGKSLVVGLGMGLAECQAQECGCHPTDHGALAKFYAEETLIKGVLGTLLFSSLMTAQNPPNQISEGVNQEKKEFWKNWKSKI